MASSLRRGALHLASSRPPASSFSTRLPFSTTDALVEVKPGEVGIISGIPDGHLRRRVIIYSPARSATQQGSGKVGRWKINFLSTHKWENPLMGWTSTGDPYANVGEAGLSFDSAEAAIAFAQKHGWEYQVKKRHAPLLKAAARMMRGQNVLGALLAAKSTCEISSCVEARIKLNAQVLRRQLQMERTGQPDGLMEGDREAPDPTRSGRNRLGEVLGPNGTSHAAAEITFHLYRKPPESLAPSVQTNQ